MVTARRVGRGALIARPRCAPWTAAAAAFLAWGAPLGLAAQATLETSLDTTLLTVGDRITLTVSVEHQAGATVEWPDSLDLAPFEVLAAQAAEPTTTGDRTTSRASFSLTTFELGALDLPSFGVTVRGADGSEQVLATDRYAVEVMSVGVDEGGDIRAIRGPLSIPVSVLRIGLWLLALVLIGTALYAMARRLRRREPPADAPVEPSRPPHEIALDALARLEASAMLERGAVKEFHIEVSEILRRYIEARYRVPALEMTTAEVLSGLARVGVGAEFREGLRRFLDQCDMVKFAKVRPTPEASREVLALGRSLVEASVEHLVGVGAAEAPAAAATVAAAHATAATASAATGRAAPAPEVPAPAATGRAAPVPEERS